MWLLLLFCIGYFAITLEQFIRLNKVATALIMAALLWTVYGAETVDQGHVLQELRAHLGQISEILFFLLGAMTIVELIDAHDGFEIVTSRITTRSKLKLLWVISGISFFLSAVLDNLTTAIVMVTLVRKIIPDKSFRLFCCGFIILAANSGGAWSPIGDVTTTMLWIGGQISAGPVMQQVFLPSLLSVVIPLIAVSVQLRGSLEANQLASTPVTPLQTKERRIIFISGLSILILIPVFKTLTHLPPYMGMLLGLGLIWVITEILHQRRNTEQKNQYSVMVAIQKADTPSILFFLGILLSVAALESAGWLAQAASGMDQYLGNRYLIASVIGVFSAVVDNVPLVAASMAMYPLSTLPADAVFWHFLAYCAGTGGSILIIGSAAGVAAMGMENIPFFWYVKKISGWALLGYLSGIAIFLVQAMG